MHINRSVSLATTFSGIGAVEQAFKRLKIPHKIIFAGDICPFVKKSYFANYDIDETRWHNDITQFNASSYKNKVDILAVVRLVKPSLWWANARG